MPLGQGPTGCHEPGSSSSWVELPQVTEMEELHRFMGASLVDDHFRLFAAMIAGAPASEYEEGELPARGSYIFPAQCWRDFVCAQLITKLLASHRVMVVAGCGHTDFGLGIPNRVQALAKQHMRSEELLDQFIITVRLQTEELTTTLRGHALANVVIRYNDRLGEEAMLTR